MKQQILIINGGNTFPTYDEYITYLKNKEIKLERMKPAREWKDTLQEDLGDKFEVFIARMPNNTNARLEEWKIWFEKIIDKLEDNIILVGHSLGGIFLAKYLDENKLSKKVKATILVAAPFNDKDLDEPLGEFNINSSLQNFTEQAGEVYLIQSKDDPVVPIGQIDKYRELLPHAKTIILDGMGHFKVEKFPELTELITNLK